MRVLYKLNDSVKKSGREREKPKVREIKIERKRLKERESQWPGGAKNIPYYLKYRTPNIMIPKIKKPKIKNNILAKNIMTRI